MEDYLTAKQACEQLGIHINTFYRWVKSGRLVAVKPGGAKTSGWRVAQTTIDLLLAGVTTSKQVR